MLAESSGQFCARQFIGGYICPYLWIYPVEGELMLWGVEDTPCLVRLLEADKSTVLVIVPASRTILIHCV